MPDKKLYKKERFTGCMVGAAIGDALGYQVKTMNVNEIKKAYGKKGILKFKPEKKQDSVRISDETQLVLFTAHGILWGDSMGAKTEAANYTSYVFYAYQQWLYTQLGGTSSTDLQWVLDDEQTGYPCELLDIPELAKKRSPTKQLLQTLSDTTDTNYGKLIKPINNNKLFDCVPRVVPAGLYFYSDPERAFRMGCEFAAITHGAPTAYLSAGCLAAIIAYICQGNSIERSALNTLKILKDYDGFEDCFAALDKALALAEDDQSPVKAVAELGNGSSAESALAIGVYCACVHYDFTSVVQLAVNQDGNSDACAAIAGALKGAYKGYSAIPSKWVKKLQFADDIKSMSAKLTKAAPKSFTV